MLHYSSGDPFASILAPPPDETPEEKAARERAEAEARRVSESIDEQIEQERIALTKENPIKILLLGQRESGKSTMLKNFQLRYAPRQWAENRADWRVVVFLNLICNVIRVLDALLHEMDQDSPGALYASESDLELPPHIHDYRFTDKHRLLKLRLAPLRRVQVDLEKRLGQGSQEVRATTSLTSLGQDLRLEGRSRELSVISRNSWRSAFEKMRPSREDNCRPESALRRREEESYDVADILAGCRNDMKNLWEDAVVQQILRDQKAQLEGSPGFFLNDIERIASKDYAPSDDDIMRAQFRTVGVREHDILIEEGPRTRWVKWLTYDAGATRSSRAVWASFFDDVATIIFLSPVSGFDEKVPEDARVNRLEDSYQLWCSVCASRLLAKTPIVLILNKCDLLHKKLKQGVRIKDFIPSFGERQNDVSTAVQYFRSSFKEISKLVSPEPRPFFAYVTSVIDTTTVSVVKEGILRTQGKRAHYKALRVSGKYASTLFSAGTSPLD